MLCVVVMWRYLDLGITSPLNYPLYIPWQRPQIFRLRQRMRSSYGPIISRAAIQSSFWKKFVEAARSNKPVINMHGYRSDGWCWRHRSSIYIGLITESLGGDVMCSHPGVGCLSSPNLCHMIDIRSGGWFRTRDDMRLFDLLSSSP